MNRLVQAVLGLLGLALLLQAAAYFKSSPLSKTMPLMAAVPDTSNRSLDFLETMQVTNLSADPAGTNAEHRLWRKVVASSLKNATSPSRRAEKERRGLHRHHYAYPFLMVVPRACSNPTAGQGKSSYPELVIVVISAIGNFDVRQSVRDTWGSYSNDSSHNVSLVFLVGRNFRSPKLQLQLEKESRIHGDLVQGDFLDSYRNLTIKSVMLLKWVRQFCAHSTYVLKIDDDMYINIPNLLSALRKESQAHSVFVMGFVFEGSKPIQNKRSKWYTPLEQLNGKKQYPRYTSGTAYSMTMSAAKRLYEATAQVPFFWIEDVYITGLCARAAKVPVVHHNGFNYRHQINICRMRKTISAHQVTMEEKQNLFKEIYDPQVKCKKTVAG